MLPVPDGLATVEVSAFEPQLHAGSFTVVANGGTSAQLVPLLRKMIILEHLGIITLRVLDLQRDGVTEL